MIRKRRLNDSVHDGGMEDVNEQELAKLTAENEQLFEEINADKDGDGTQTLSTFVFEEKVTEPEENEGGATGEESIRTEDVDKRAELPLPVTEPSAPIPISENETEDTAENTAENTGDSVTDDPDSGKEDPPPPQSNTKIPPKSKRGGGVYVAVILMCLVLSLALLAFGAMDKAQSADTLDTVSSSLPPHDSETGTEHPTDTVLDATGLYSAHKSSSVTVIASFADEQRYFSGTAVFSGGYVVTVYEDIAGADKLQIVTSEGRFYGAAVEGYDATVDIALLKSEAQGLVGVSDAGIRELCVGERLYAIGTATDARFGGSLFEGVVSFGERAVELDLIDKTDGSAGGARRAMTVGVSGFAESSLRGSPVYDESGAAVAMVWGGGTDASVGLVVPMSRILAVAECFKNGDVPDGETLECIAYGVPSLGVIGEDVSNGDWGGVLVKDFVSPVSDTALKLRRDDIIVQIGDALTPNTEAVKQIIYRYRPKDVVEVHVIRNTQKLSFFIMLD